jgi:hypothetical protein
MLKIFIWGKPPSAVHRVKLAAFLITFDKIEPGHVDHKNRQQLGSSVLAGVGQGICVVQRFPSFTPIHPDNYTTRSPVFRSARPGAEVLERLKRNRRERWKLGRRIPGVEFLNKIEVSEEKHGSR